MKVILTSAINIATQEEIVNFIMGACELASVVNNQVASSGIQISRIVLTHNPRERPSIDPQVYSNSQLPVDILDTRTSATIKHYRKRKLEGLGHWWMGSAEMAFNSNADYVFYLPVDLCWNISPHNTVVDPEYYAQMIQAIDDNKPDLIIGNYKTKDHTKEWAESLILGQLMGVFSDHPCFSTFQQYFGYFKKDKISRVRTEFWGMKRSFFDSFRLIDDPHVKSDDPTLQLILSAILDRKTIKVVDLGYYATKTGRGYPMRQLKRVDPITCMYRMRYANWT